MGTLSRRIACRADILGSGSPRCCAVQCARPATLRAAGAVHVDARAGLRGDRLADGGAVQLVATTGPRGDTGKRRFEPTFRLTGVRVFNARVQPRLREKDWW
jgi:hypothetical protein